MNNRSVVGESYRVVQKVCARAYLLENASHEFTHPLSYNYHNITTWRLIYVLSVLK
jgi:hypothetical protein